MESYRSSKDYREILRILQKASSLQENFLWQSHANGKTIIPIHHFEIDFVTREVVIYFDHNNAQINPEMPLYVKLDYRTSVFKVTEFRQSQNEVHFAFPVEIKTMELRAFPRLAFQANDDKVVSVKPSLSGNRDAGNELQVRAVDISQYGLGLLVSEQNRSFLKNNRILWLTKLGDETLDYPILAEVVYMNNEIEPKFQMKRQKDLKVGLKLSGFVPNHIYQRFVQ